MKQSFESGEVNKENILNMDGWTDGNKNIIEMYVL